MRLRDQFAIAAMQGLLASDQDGAIFWSDGKLVCEKLAEQAYEIAYWMVKYSKEESVLGEQ